MNKNLISKLIKVASDLDEMGLIKEANIIDGISKDLSITIASVIPPGFIDHRPKPVGDYKKDIEKYKQIIEEFQNEKDPGKKRSLAQDATYFLNFMWDHSGWSNQKKSIFLEQAHRIRNTIYNSWDQEKINNQLSKDLIDLKILDKSGNLIIDKKDSMSFTNKLYELQKKYNVDKNKYNKILIDSTIEMLNSKFYS